MKTRVLLTISVFVVVLLGAFLLCNQPDDSTDRDDSQALKNLEFDSALVKGTSNEEGNPDGADRKRNTDRRMMT